MVAQVADTLSYIDTKPHRGHNVLLSGTGHEPKYVVALFERNERDDFGCRGKRAPCGSLSLGFEEG